MTEVLIGHKCNDCPWEGSFPDMSIEPTLGSFNHNVWICPVCHSSNIKEVKVPAVKCPECGSNFLEITDFKVEPESTIYTDELVSLPEVDKLEVRCYTCGYVIKPR